MSKHKPYHNYQNYNNNQNRTEQPVIPEVTEEPVVIEEVEVVEPAVETPEVVEAVEVEEVPVEKIGIVTDCLKLNVRENPDPEAKVVCTIDALTEVMIDEDASTKDFYKVCTSAGAEGYCMKKYIAVR